MKNKLFKIAILEDDKFYNSMITKRIEQFTYEIMAAKGIYFEILSFTSHYDFIKNLPVDTNMAIIDYYLDEKVNGGEMLIKTAQKCTDCKVFIISNVNSIKTSLVPILEGATGFIHKDRAALSVACDAVEDTIRKLGYF